MQAWLLSMANHEIPVYRIFIASALITLGYSHNIINGWTIQQRADKVFERFSELPRSFQIIAEAQENDAAAELGLMVAGRSWSDINWELYNSKE